MIEKMYLSDEVIKEVEGKIGYKFKRPGDLSLAFRRKSFTEEALVQGLETNNNEVMEFFGDAVLKYCIVNAISDINEIDGKHINESNLSNFISYWTDKSMLSSVIKELDISKYLIMSKGDIEKQVWKSPSVMEDLFESIIGAIWFDCDKDYNKVSEIIFRLLDFRTDDYNLYLKNEFMVLKEFIDRNKDYSFEKNASGNYELKRNDEVLAEYDYKAENKHLTKIRCASLAIQYLKENKLWDREEIELTMDGITYANAINKLQELVQKKLLKYTVTYSDGKYNRETKEWAVECFYGELVSKVGVDRNKGEAKKISAYMAYEDIVNNQDYYINQD